MYEKAFLSLLWHFRMKNKILEAKTTKYNILPRISSTGAVKKENSGKIVKLNIFL